ncbi:MAG: HDOD domain-containing protein [Deltaproteobacteria bacterium]|nr:HDOD domain-containing protein [Deltaproteobacteria bacterium]
MMQRVALDQLKEGMVLFEGARDINGRLLLGEGSEIKSSHISIFKKWGVTEVSISGEVDNQEDDKTGIDFELFERAAKNVKNIFQHAGLSHPFMKELFRLSVLHRFNGDNFEPLKKVKIPEADEPNNVIKIDLKSELSKKEITLPEISTIVSDLNEVIDDPQSSAEDIATVVNKSPSLAARLLKIVNSSFYGFQSRIDSISRAVAEIGTREIASLAIGLSAISVFKDIPKEIADMHLFLKHSLACGLLSRIIAAHNNIPQTEQLFVAGLLHDIGRVVIYKDFPEQASALLRLCAGGDELLYREEKNRLGCKHTDVGKILLAKWNLPETLVHSVFYHHNPSKAREPVWPSIVHLADIIVNGLGLGSSGERCVPQLDEKALNIIGFSPGILKIIVKQATHQFTSFVSFLKE